MVYVRVRRLERLVLSSLSAIDLPALLPSSSEGVAEKLASSTYFITLTNSGNCGTHRCGVKLTRGGLQ